MAEKEEKEPEVTPVGPGAEEEEVHAESDEREAERASSEDDGDEEDERVGRSEEDDDGEDEGDGRKSRRRHERKRRRERDKLNRVELNFLRQRNEQLERRFSEVDVRLEQSDIGNIDSRIGQLDSQIAEAERLHAEAITKANGAAATEALQIRDQLRDERNNLNYQKGQRVQNARQRQQQGQQTAQDPVALRNTENWLAENDWFDPQLGDEDSRIARAIEDSLFAEKGPQAARSQSYWDEFNRRLAKRGLGPNARRGNENGNGNGRDRDRDRDEDDDYEDEQEEKPTKRQARGPRITTGGRERSLKKGEVYVSAERRAAMEEAGVWDKPELRNKYLRQYAKYDAEHRGDNRRR